jgi:hypothetical protein
MNLAIGMKKLVSGGKTKGMIENKAITQKKLFLLRMCL